MLGDSGIDVDLSREVNAVIAHNRVRVLNPSKHRSISLSFVPGGGPLIAIPCVRLRLVLHDLRVIYSVSNL